MKFQECCAENPVISVIVPVYHTEQYLARCLESIGHQSFRDLEIIVVNDASPGDVRSLMIPFLKNDPRIRFLDSRKHEGLFRARLRGVKAARGSYIAFADSDDYLSFDFLRPLYMMARRSGADIVIGRTVRVDGEKRLFYPLHEAFLPKGVLTGREAFEQFFRQEFNVYAWHTMWNKLYSRSLWERSLPYLETVKPPVCMGEDILFSAVLYGNAFRVAGPADGVYFYCFHKGAATDPELQTSALFRERVSDLTGVFSEVSRYISETAETAGNREFFREHLAAGCARYERMWRHLLSRSAFPAGEKRKARRLLRRLKDLARDGMTDCQKTGSDESDWFAESIAEPWSGRFEYLKDRIANGPEKTIGFDIFGTLLERPLEKPDDLFELLESTFREAGGSGSYAELRKKAADLARKKGRGSVPVQDDVNFAKIGEALVQDFGLPEEVVLRMQAEELSLERRLLCVRESGRSLLELAVLSGKNTVLISDMYLPRDILTKLLKEKGLAGWQKIYVSSEYGRLKRRGDLFRCVLEERGISPDEMLFIGDSWENDIEGSRSAGIKSLFLPSGQDVMQNRIEGCHTGLCGTLGRRSGLPEDIYESAELSLGCRIMKSMTARTVFDNPYRDFPDGSALGCDPFLAGYYTGGMHLLGIARFIDQAAADREGCCIHFLARDGYLPMKAYELYRSCTETDVTVHYLRASRQMLLPAMLRVPEAFYEMPVRPEGHSPQSLMPLLSFAFGGQTEEFGLLLRRDGIEWERPFEDAAAFRRFMTLFLSFGYSPEKHRQALERLKECYKDVKEGDLLFDAGYSGRIPEAISGLTGFGTDALFIHDDHDAAEAMQKKGGFRILSMYPHRPRVTGLIREFFLSDPRAGCAAGPDPGEDRPVRQSAAGYLVIDAWQQGALQFVKEFLDTFGDHLSRIAWSPLEVSLPFEEYLRHMPEPDRRVLAPCCSDDAVYGGKQSVRLKELLEEVYEAIDPGPETQGQIREADSREALLCVLNQHTKPVRGLILAACDRSLFKEKLVRNLKGMRDDARSRLTGVTGRGIPLKAGQTAHAAYIR